ncbi:MAG: hypothetical protein IJK54_09850 [Clostridia bacterium]|nr:hypothetical protein [Clostridia bacterium]
MKETRQESIFDRAKTVTALDAAEQFAMIEGKRIGRRVKACCPLHNEKTPSCVFYENGTFYCFGCHAGGTSIDFTMAYFHESSVDAAKRIVSAFGLGEVGAFDPDAGREARRFRDVTESVRRTASFTHAVTCAVIHWCTDQMDKLDPGDESPESEAILASLLKLKNDAENLTEAINALERANRTGNLQALLSSVSAVSRERYEMLKTWDETQGTCYVRGMRA